MAQSESPDKADGTRQFASELAHVENLFTISLDWRRWWRIVPEIIILCCVGVLPVVVVANVVARYTNWYHVIWATDVVKVLFLWIVFLGGALAVKYEAHVRMSMLSDRLARRGFPGTAWGHVIRISPLAVGFILLVLGVRIVDISMYRELPTLRISAGYFTTIVPISGALMIYYAARGLRPNRQRKAGAMPVLNDKNHQR